MSDQATRQLPPGGVDPAVKVPASVRAAAARSAELFKAAQEANGIVDPNAPPAEPPAPPADDTITIAPPEPPKPRQRAEPKAPEVPSAPPIDTPPVGDAAKWKNDFEAMKGRFEKANQNNIRLAEEIGNLRGLLATMNAAPPSPATPPPPELRPASLLTDSERTEYGEDFLDVVGRKAREIAAAELGPLKQELENLKKVAGSTASITQQQAREAMFAKMDEKVPNWKEVNTDPNFLQWLLLPDAFSGVIRQELLNAAFEQNNTPRVLAFFNGFLTEEAAVAPAIETPLAPPAPAKVPLETFAAPGRAKSAAAPTPTEKPIISRAQVAAFYADVASGKYRGRDEEKAKNEAIIFSAQAEGRIR